nr:NAD(P)-binding domain-containing protein [Mycolicibacterium hodleri]
MNSNISIIGLGNMATALAQRALAGGNAVEIIGRDPAKVEELATSLDGATVGTFGTAPAGDIVILAVPYTNAVDVVRQFGDALAGKVIIDISNTFSAPDDTELVTPEGSSGAQELTKAVPATAHVVKAFNTVFGHVLALGRPLDVVFAGDDELAKASVAAFIKSLGLRPHDVGGLAMARWLEGLGLLMMGLAGHGAGFDIALGVDVVSIRDDVPKLSEDKITQVVRSYLELAGHGSAEGQSSADEVAHLFADNAIFESGGNTHRGIDAIRSAYHSLWDGREQEIELVSLKVAGAGAAVHLQVIFSGQRVDVIDVMSFDEDAKIASLRTY